jgi:hypothetical protein
MKFNPVIFKTVGELIDALITTDIKCFMAQEHQANPLLTNEERLDSANKVMELNKKRCNLTRAIDQRLGMSSGTVTLKTYLPDLEDNLDKEF